MIKHLWLVVTRGCNLQCAYCYQGDHGWTWQKEAGLSRCMSPETMDATLEWAIKAAGPHLIVTFYGGEPLLQKQLIRDTVEKWTLKFSAVNKTIAWSITTNGTMLDLDFRKWMDERNIGILMSLDGPPWIHDNQRTRSAGKGPSWKHWHPENMLKWRPDLDIVWQLSPLEPFYPQDLDWMISEGFRSVNFNIVWSLPWQQENLDQLGNFARHALRLAIQSNRGGPRFSTNLMGKIEKIVNRRTRLITPCGTTAHNLAVSPEGLIYQSQELVFTVYEPGRADGTWKRYLVGDVSMDPVLNQEQLEKLAILKVDDLKPEDGQHCDDCVARLLCVGGCHCRMAGMMPNPEGLASIPKNMCTTERVLVSAMLDAVAIEGYWPVQRSSMERIEKKIDVLAELLAEAPLVKMEIDDGN